MKSMMKREPKHEPSDEIKASDDMQSVRGRNNKGTKQKHDKGDKHEHHDKRRKGQNSQHKPSFRKAFRGGNIEENLDPEEDLRKHDEKLLTELSQSLLDCSRQRLRAVHMSFRQYGNDQSKMSGKELHQSFQDNGISIPSRTLKPLSKKFEGSTGIDLEGLYKFLTDAHCRTGRDSVLAMYKRNDVDRRHDVSQDEVDEDFLWRIESQLIKSHDYVDIHALRTELQRLDGSNTGRLESTLLKQTCTDMQIPVFGALLKNLMKRCDERKDGKVSWPEFLVFLERAQENAWKSCPSLKELPEKQRNKTPVAPSPLDELSTRARTTIVNKLRKKTSVKKAEVPNMTGATVTAIDEAKSKVKEGDTSAKTTQDETNTKTEHNLTQTLLKDSSTKKPQDSKQNGEASKDRLAETKIEIKVETKKLEHINENEVKVNTADNKNSEADDSLKVTKNTGNLRLLRRETPIDIRVHEPSDGPVPDKLNTKDDHVQDINKVPNVQDTKKDAKTKDTKMDENANSSKEGEKVIDTKINDKATDVKKNENVIDKPKDGKAIDTKNDEREGDTRTDVKERDAENVEKQDGSKGDNEEKVTTKDDDVGDNKNAEEDKPADATDHEDIKHADKDPNITDDTTGDIHQTLQQQQAAPVNTETDEQYENMTQDQTTISVNIRGKQIEFIADKEYLRSQTIDPPRERLKLNWVYGYRGNDCRNNIHVLQSKEIVYFVAHLAIIYDPHQHRQRHYKEHTDEIKCIDVHSNKLLVATGQYASRKNPNIKAHIRVWRADNLHTLHVLGNDVFEKHVACLAFSPGKDLLAAVDNCLEKNLTIWDTESGELKGQELLHTDLVCDVSFNNVTPDVVVTVGKEHLCWWKVYPGSDKIQPAANPDYESFLKAKFVICSVHNDGGDLITGDSNGTIYVFGDGGNKITNFVKHAHDGPVFTAVFYRGHILSGGRDGIIHCWEYNKNMDSAGFLQIAKTEGGVRMLRVYDNKLYIGTTMNSILVATLGDGESPVAGATVDPVPVTQCHYDDLRGLACVPGSGTDVLSAGLDGIVCGFNSTDRRCVSKFQMKGNQYISIDANAAGSLLALGSRDGQLYMLEKKGDQWTDFLQRKLCKDRIDIVRFSPDYQWVAAGSHDQSVYIVAYKPTDDGTAGWDCVGKLEGHTSYINGIDWSSKKYSDGYILRTSSSSMELFYWLPESVQSFDNHVPADIDWASNTVLVDVSIAGILATKCSLDTEAVTMSSNPSKSLLIMGDNSGGLSLFRYPSSLKGVFCHGYKSHAVVYSAKFTPSGQYVISVGGRDSCIMQWEVV